MGEYTHLYAGNYTCMDSQQYVYIAVKYKLSHTNEISQYIDAERGTTAYTISFFKEQT